MSLIPNLNDIPELEVVAPGEYDLRISRAKVIKSKKTGRQAIFLACEIIGEENAEDVLHSLWLPMDSDDPSKANTMWRMIKEFISGIGMPLDGIDEDAVQDFVDVEFSAILDIGEDLSGKEINEIKRVV